MAIDFKKNPDTADLKKVHKLDFYKPGSKVVKDLDEANEEKPGHGATHVEPAKEAKTSKSKKGK